MNYPQEFIDKCKEVYPTWDDLHRLLDSGNRFAGRLLDDGCCGDDEPTNKQILECKNIDELKLLQAKAKKYQDRAQLYYDWCKLDDAQTPKIR
jgi:hypothetical protein